MDDQREVRAQAVAMLREAALLPGEIYEAETVETAVELAYAKRPSLILLDVVLPDGNGFDVLERLRDRGYYPSTIMMTAFPQFDYAMQAVNSQVKGFLVKPLETHEFTRILLSAQGQELNQRQRHLSFTMLDVYLRGQQLNMRLDEVREHTGINRLQGKYYVALIASVERSAALERRVMRFWSLLREAGLDSVNYLQDTGTLVALFRTDQPDALLLALEPMLRDAFGYFVAGCSDPQAETGVRGAYQRAAFALDYAVSMQIQGQVIRHSRLNVAKILTQRRRGDLAAGREEAAEELMLEFARQGVSAQSAAEALKEFCEAEAIPGFELDYASLGRVEISFRRALEAMRRGGTDKGSAQLRRVKEYVDEHFTENINRSSIVRDLGISYSYVGDLFRGEMGVSLTEYIHRRKIQCATELLSGTRLSVGEIASRTGYVDSKSFIRAFARHYGMTPGQWRIRKRDGQT